MDDIRLTQYSKGSGCGCKLAPLDLEEILSAVQFDSYDELLLGNDTRDDAAIYDNGDGTALISTTDFFTPIVDDAENFGKIAAVNAINDIYAMGGKPIMAIAILGWPIDKLPASLAGKVMKGGKDICKLAGIPLAGGHSIDSPEPFFGLAVNGIVKIEHIKYNNSAKVGDRIFLTKPLGTGIISTATKREKAEENDVKVSENQMMGLNDIGIKFGQLDYIHAMTDVTGFGLAGHLIEVCEGSQVSANIDFEKVPLFPNNILDKYLEQFIFPDNTFRNFKAYGDKLSTLSGTQLQILCDPQTSGGLLVTVDPAFESDFLKFTKENDLHLDCFGEIVKKEEKTVVVK